jgi:hypothetical protein
VSDLLSRYSPRWLYLEEFMEALPGTNTAEKQEAVLLLIRDRLIVGGSLDETNFRFLTGKPQIEDATWLANLSHADVAWSDSSIRSLAADNSFTSEKWFLIEIASAGLSLFSSRTSAKEPSKAPHRTSPEQARALKAIKEIYGRIPPQDEVSNSVLDHAVNKHLKEKGLESVKKDALMRAAGRRIDKRN